MINNIFNYKNLQEQLSIRGYTDTFPFLSNETLVKLKNKIDNFDNILNNTDEKDLDIEVQKIFFDQELRDIGSNKNLNSTFLNFFSNLLGSHNIEKYRIADYFIRVNYNRLKNFYTKWHQDTGTFLFDKNNCWNNLSYTIWVSLTDSDEENSLEFEKTEIKNNYLFNSIFIKSPRHGRQLFYETIIPENKTNNTFKIKCPRGHAIIFDSLSIHKTVKLPSSKFRVSFDARFYEKNTHFIKNIHFKNKIKRFFFEKANIKIYKW